MTYEEGLVCKMPRRGRICCSSTSETSNGSTVGLTRYNNGLKDGGPTASGHLHPHRCLHLALERHHAGGSALQCLAGAPRADGGVHSILHAPTRNESVRAFVQITRYPFHTLGCAVIGEGCVAPVASARPTTFGASPPRTTPVWPTRGR
ncbi:MAG: hypothetical protein R2867_11650 [Caldilineaceae bacterium]